MKNINIKTALVGTLLLYSLNSVAIGKDINIQFMKKMNISNNSYISFIDTNIKESKQYHKGIIDLKKIKTKNGKHIDVVYDKTVYDSYFCKDKLMIDNISATYVKIDANGKNKHNERYRFSHPNLLRKTTVFGFENWKVKQLNGYRAFDQILKEGDAVPIKHSKRTREYYSYHLKKLSSRLKRDQKEIKYKGNTIIYIVAESDYTKKGKACIRNFLKNRRVTIKYIDYKNYSLYKN